MFFFFHRIALLPSSLTFGTGIFPGLRIVAADPAVGKFLLLVNPNPVRKFPCGVPRDRQSVAPLVLCFYPSLGPGRFLLLPATPASPPSFGAFLVG